eukprot:c18982_g1_i1 orf=242-889(+)
MRKVVGKLFYNRVISVAINALSVASLPVFVPSTFIVAVTVSSVLIFPVGCGALAIVCMKQLAKFYEEQKSSEVYSLVKHLDTPVPQAASLESESKREIMVEPLIEETRGTFLQDDYLIRNIDCENVRVNTESSQEKQGISDPTEQAGEESIRNSIAMVKRILGDKSPERGSIVEEIQSLCLLTGIEPRAMYEEELHVMEKIRDELSVLQVVIGVK